LALALGMTVREMLGKLDSRELTEWMALDGMDPIGQERDDLRAGIVASVVANCHSTKGRFKPSDFVPKFGPRAEKRKTPTELAAMAQAITGLMRKKV
jgi:hypothetical protein